MLSVPSTNIVSDFRSFVLDNNILTSMSAVTIAFSTGTMIRSFVSDIFLPGLYGFFIKKTGKLEGAFKPISNINIDNFIKEFITFVFVVISIFVFVYYIFKNFVKPKNKQPAMPVVVQEQVKRNDKGGDTAGAVIADADGFMNYRY